VPARQTVIELIFEARDGTHAAEIITALRAAGFAVLVPAP